jgi:hypothetical protein
MAAAAAITRHFVDVRDWHWAIADELALLKLSNILHAGERAPDDAYALTRFVVVAGLARQPIRS